MNGRLGFSTSMAFFSFVSVSAFFNRQPVAVKSDRGCRNSTIEGQAVHIGSAFLGGVVEERGALQVTITRRLGPLLAPHLNFWAVKAHNDTKAIASG